MLERAQELASRGGAVRLAPEAASWIPAVMSYGPVPAPQVDERWQALRASASMSRYARAFGDLLDALSLAMMGEFDRARAQWVEAQSVLAELGDELHAAATNMQRGYIELLAGEPAAAERFLAEGEKDLERQGEGGFRSTVQCLLADALQGLGRIDQAIAATERAEGLSFPDDFETLAGWRMARARALADLGAQADAERFAREALDIVEPTESLDTQARAWSSLGYVLASAGRSHEAVEAYAEALDRFVQKGNLPSAERVRRTIATLRGEGAGAAETTSGAWGTTWPRGA
jgi:tetratricopeptide (TPR) repeat protein